MNTEFLDAKIAFATQPFARALQLSSGVIATITEAQASVTVRANGIEAQGKGSIYLSDLWAWPESPLSHEERDRILRAYCKRIAARLCDWCDGEPSHPLELGLRLHRALEEEPNELPTLARAMCGSPFDAAIHDACGKALRCCAFDFYRETQPIPAADRLFPQDGACAAIGRLLRPPHDVLDAWLVVGAHDSLQDIILPEIFKHGYRCFKLKLTGRDIEADIARTREVFHAVRTFVESPRLSGDSNEANSDASSVLEYLRLLQERDSAAFAALEYLEQPTSRDIWRNAYNWRDVAKLKPVLLDEGLTDFESMEEAVRQGWSGFALKTCKGHSFALIAAAWAHERGLKLALQDLTNPGLAAIHSFLFAAHVPTCNGVEINSPQFTPAANMPWLPRLSGLFEPGQGVHHLAETRPPGLGSTL
jgi:L-alanine-DL-glutamate epimerase-like enolase superfamily enzyme